MQDAEECIINAQKKQKKNMTESLNQLILLLEKRCYLRILQRKGGKRNPALLGPYIVNRCIGRGLYELSKGDRVVKNKAILGNSSYTRIKILEHVRMMGRKCVSLLDK